MPFPSYEAKDVAKVAMKPEGSYGDHLDMAIKQATLLFKLGTGLTEFPTDEQDMELANYGILSMADTIYVKSRFTDIQANPFTSETIGSYSYSKQAMAAIKAGMPTGVMWFDLAIEHLKAADESAITYGGIHVFNDDPIVKIEEELYALLSPIDLHADDYGTMEIQP